MSESIVEKYRPANLDEVVGQTLVVKKIKNMIANNLFSNLLFIGPPGIGKTSVAQCIAKEFWRLNWKESASGQFSSEPTGSWSQLFHWFHGRELTVTRINTTIKQLTEYVGRRIIFIDEADGLDKKDQEALRPLMEGSRNATFILSCNNEDSIHDAVSSRCTILKFKMIKPEDVYKRLFEICNKEHYIQPGDPPIVNQFLIRLSRQAGGDLRRAINDLEPYISEGKVDLELINEYLEGR